jgi:PAS domain S-box-containing protein
MRSLLIAIVLLALLAAGFQWVWLPTNVAALKADVRVLSLSPEAAAALIGDVRGQQQMLLLAFAAIGLATIAGLWFGLAQWIRRPTSDVTELALRLARGDFQGGAPPAATGPFGTLGRTLGEIGAALDAATTLAHHEATLRERAEAALRASEERYALAIRCANEGLWEWDMKSELAYYAANWKALLGYGEEELGRGESEWTDRIHPEDREATIAALDAHIAGETASFESDHRLLHKDGSYRWFCARGQMVRSASGRPYKLVGLITDITARKRTEQVLVGIAKGLSQPRGDAFFDQLVRNFADVLDTKMAFICECADRPTTRVRMLSWWNDGKFAENVEFDLEGTPCDAVIAKGELTFVACGVDKLFPKEAGYESYLGLPIFGRTGDVIGHLACFDTKPMPNDLPRLPIFTIFAVRAGIEIEQRMLERGSAIGQARISFLES